jgi:hypothetical protein
MVGPEAIFSFNFLLFSRPYNHVLKQFINIHLFPSLPGSLPRDPCSSSSVLFPHLSPKTPPKLGIFRGLLEKNIPSLCNAIACHEVALLH